MNQAINHTNSPLLVTTVQIKLYDEYLGLHSLMLAVQGRVNLCVSVPHKYRQMHSYIIKLPLY